MKKTTTNNSQSNSNSSNVPSLPTVLNSSVAEEMMKEELFSRVTFTPENAMFMGMIAYSRIDRRITPDMDNVTVDGLRNKIQSMPVELHREINKILDLTKWKNDRGL